MVILFFTLIGCNSTNVWPDGEIKFTSSKSVGRVPIITPLTLGWDSVTTYSTAIVSDINNNPILIDGEYYLFYAGGGGVSNPKHELEIGFATFTDPLGEYTKQGLIISRESVGLSGPGQGLAPFDVKYINGRYYMFVTAIYSNVDIRIATLESTDLINWNNYKVIFDYYQRNHAPFILLDPDDNEKLIMYFSYIPEGGTCYRIGRAKASITDLSFWENDSVNNPVLVIRSEFSVYPCVIYDGENYNLYYARSVGDKFKIYRTLSTDGANFNNLYGNVLILNVEPYPAWDSGYVTVPRIYNFDGNTFLYFSARKYGENYYSGIGNINL